MTKRLVFSSSSVAALRGKCADHSMAGDPPRRPTRIGALSAFIWSRYVSVTHGMANTERGYIR